MVVRSAPPHTQLFKRALHGKLEPPAASLNIPRGSSSAATRSKSARPGSTDAM